CGRAEGWVECWAGGGGRPAGLFLGGGGGGTAGPPALFSLSPPQETEIRGGEDLCNLGGAKLGKVEAISFADNTVDIKKRQDTAGLHPQAVFAHRHVSGQVMADALVRIGEYVADRGVRGARPAPMPGASSRAQTLRSCSRYGKSETGPISLVIFRSSA